MHLCRITINSHSVVVDKLTTSIIPLIRMFSRGFILYESKKIPRTNESLSIAKEVYAASPQDGREYRFARECLDDLLSHLKYYQVYESQIEIVERPMYVPGSMVVQMPATWIPREQQVPIIDYVVKKETAEENRYHRMKIITMQTGRGKTDLTLKSMELIGHKTMAIMPAKYVEQWEGKLVNSLGLVPGRMVVIAGLKQFMAIMQLVYANECSPEMYLVSSTTMSQYLSMYESVALDKLPKWFIHPDMLYEKLGVGLRIIDEAHEFFHLNFKIDLYTHVPKSLSLSATLDPDSDFLKRMYQLIFPLAARKSGGTYIKYVDVTTVMYHLEFWQKAKYTGAMGYNHSIFEEWMTKKGKPLTNYLRMILKVVIEEYVKKKKPGQRLLIYAAKIETCAKIRDYLAEHLDDDLVISKYTADDPFETLLNSDISVTTLGSAGTGVDVPNLLACIMTTALSSSQRNMQVLGRLRELYDNPDQNPHFIYLCCRDIKKHMEYHYKKQELFTGKVLSHRSISYSEAV